MLTSSPPSAGFTPSLEPGAGRPARVAEPSLAIESVVPRPPAPVADADSRFVFVAERLWLDFVNTDDVRRGVRVDTLCDFATFVDWLGAAGALDEDRASGMLRRAAQQPAGAAAALLDARRVRSAFRVLAERGAGDDPAQQEALLEINRVLGRSMGTRRVERGTDGLFARTFVPVGDAFAGLLIPIVESAADSLIDGELDRVRRCADPRCVRVFHDGTKNARRRWCDMAICGNRAKAARHRARRA